VSEPQLSGALAKKLAAVMGAVKRVPKTGHNAFHGYDYATEADIVAAIRDELAQRHVILLPAILARTREPVGEKGQVLTHLDMEFTFIDGESGERETRPWLGAGTDKEDKGAYKAMTGGEKYFLLKTFLVPTGDDPEQDSQQQPAPAAQKRANGAEPVAPAVKLPPEKPAEGRQMAPISEAQRKRLFAIAKDNGWTKSQVATLLKQKLNVDSSGKVSTYRYDEVIQWLQLGVDAMANTQEPKAS
jgi:hypothetical protein